MHNRFISFLKSLSRSENILLKLGFQLSISGSCSSVSNSYVYIKEKYGVKGDITNCGGISSSTELNVSDEFLINHIRDLLCMREQPQKSILSSDETNTLLEYFCCNATIANCNSS